MARTPYDHASADLRRLHTAARLAHGWDPQTERTDIAGVFALFGPYRWLVVPLAGVAGALVVVFVGFLAGAAS